MGILSGVGGGDADRDVRIELELVGERRIRERGSVGVGRVRIDVSNGVRGWKLVSCCGR